VDRVTADTSELRTLSRDFGSAAEGAERQVRRTIQRAAFNIKKDLQDEASTSASFHRMPASISYETWEEPGAGVFAEIGPEIGRQQGSLGFIAYEGTARNGPVFPDPAGALEREAEAFERYMAAAVAGEIL
jgi:hypothetical protein